jgi:muramoyltetrapeptide carboxypeptidase LdcA involved in peptidoglycan recycling
MNESKLTGDDSSFLKTLTKHIQEQLEERGFCIVFGDDLKRCWPSNQMSEAERNSEIHRFAESQDWNAFMHKTDFDRTRAIFLPK